MASAKISLVENRIWLTGNTNSALNKKDQNSADRIFDCKCSPQLLQQKLPLTCVKGMRLSQFGQ